MMLMIVLLCCFSDMDTRLVGMATKHDCINASVFSTETFFTRYNQGNVRLEISVVQKLYV